MELELKREIIEQVKNYLADKNNINKFESYEELILTHPYIDKILKSYLRTITDIEEREHKYEELCKELPSKIVVENKYVVNGYYKPKEKTQTYMRIPKIKNPHFSDINEKINELFELNRTIKSTEMKSMDKEIINRRDLIIEEIIFHDKFAKAITYKANNMVRNYKSINIQFSYNLDSLEVVYKELITGILKKAAPEFKIEYPEGWLYSYLFKKGKFTKDMDPVDCSFKDWKEKSTTYLLNENLEYDSKSDDENEIYDKNNNYPAVLNKLAADMNDFDEIDNKIDADIEFKNVQNKKKCFERLTFWRNRPKDSYISYSSYIGYCFSETELWRVYLAHIIFLNNYYQTNTKKNYQRFLILKYYFYDNMQFKNISKMIGLDVTTVRRNYKSGIELLQQRIFQSGFYRMYPDLKSVSNYEGTPFGLKLVYSEEPGSPLMVSLLKKKKKELEGTNQNAS